MSYFNRIFLGLELKLNPGDSSMDPFPSLRTCSTSGSLRLIIYKMAAASRFWWDSDAEIDGVKASVEQKLCADFSRFVFSFPTQH